MDANSKMTSPRKAGGEYGGDSQMQKPGSPARCLMCEVLRQTKRDLAEDERAYQTWLRGRKMTNKVRAELWKIQLANTEIEKTRLDGIFKSMNLKK